MYETTNKKEAGFAPRKFLFLFFCLIYKYNFYDNLRNLFDIIWWIKAFHIDLKFQKCLLLKVKYIVSCVKQNLSINVQ